MGAGGCGSRRGVEGGDGIGRGVRWGGGAVYIYLPVPDERCEVNEERKTRDENRNERRKTKLNQKRSYRESTKGGRQLMGGHRNACGAVR